MGAGKLAGGGLLVTLARGEGDQDGELEAALRMEADLGVGSTRLGDSLGKRKSGQRRMRKEGQSRAVRAEGTWRASEALEEGWQVQKLRDQP